MLARALRSLTVAGAISSAAAQSLWTKRCRACGPYELLAPELVLGCASCGLGALDGTRKLYA
jgi:hypothetical protein